MNGATGDATCEGHHDIELEHVDLAVQEPQHFLWWGAEQRERSQCAPHPSHDHCGLKAVAGDVTDHHPEVARWQLERVVPVASDQSARGWDVPRSELDAVADRKPAGQQAALEDLGGGSFDGELASLRGAGDSFGDDLQKLGIRCGERTVVEPAHVQHADDGISRPTAGRRA